MNLSKNAITVLERRYLRKEDGVVIETPEDMFRRVAKAVASCEKRSVDPYEYMGSVNYAVGAEPREYEEKFYTMMTNLDFLPNSPTLMNAGRGLGMLSACFALPVGDSIPEIFDAVKNAALVHKGGGGTGFSFSSLRPANDGVKSTAGVASGPVSFMRVFNTATETIKQGGTRRGANMAVLSCEHPDIMDFIMCKHDKTQLNNFNISVAITDKFMQAVDKDEDYDLINPRDNSVTGQLNAKKVFNRIVKQAHENGEPGIIFIDRMNQDNPTPQLGDIVATNPCVSGDTLIMVDGYGPVEIQSMVGLEIQVWNGHEFSEVIPQKTGAKKEMLRVHFSDGSHLDCTTNHSFFIQKEDRSIKIEAFLLRPGSQLENFQYPVIQSHSYGDIDTRTAYTIGVFTGDGSLEVKKSRKSIWLYGAKRKLLDHINYKYVNECKGDRLFVCMENNFPFERDWVPTTVYPIDIRLAWLAGLMDTDAGSCGNGAYSIWSINRPFLMRTKMMLHTLGVGATLVLGKEACQKIMPDGKGGQKEYSTQDCWRLTISGSSMEKLVVLGLVTHRIDTSYVPNRAANRFIKVERLEKIGIAEEVFCFTESKRHKGMFGCVATGQCGEQPLLSYESCNLGSINLSNMVRQVGDEVIVEYTRLRETVNLAVRFLDNVIEINKFPLPQIKEATLKTRKIGLGVMGWADALIKMGIPYNSNEALILAEDVMRFINTCAREESERLAVKRGAYPECGAWWDTKVRNATRTTIAPTGTISIIANCSSGIEPIFAVSYTRTVMDDDKLVEYHPEYQRCIEAAYKPDELKRLFVTAHDITPEDHINMQAAFQKYTDNAVSKTVNFPATATPEDVADVFYLAYTTGCKGVTIYRDGSRDNQVLSTKTTDTTKRERPKGIPGWTYQQQTGCGNLYVTINQDVSGVFELFATIGKAGGCAASQSEAIGRMVSLAWRSGISDKQVIKQLRGISCHSPYGFGDKRVLSCADAVAQAIEYHRRDKDPEYKAVVVLKKGACPDCGGVIEHEGGCAFCRECGYSECV
jgi:ribonucleoside-diphosphate reductase alpha chain